LRRGTEIPRKLGAQSADTMRRRRKSAEVHGAARASADSKSAFRSRSRFWTASKPPVSRRSSTVIRNSNTIHSGHGFGQVPQSGCYVKSDSSLGRACPALRIFPAAPCRLPKAGSDRAGRHSTGLGGAFSLAPILGQGSLKVEFRDIENKIRVGDMTNGMEVFPEPRVFFRKADFFVKRNAVDPNTG